MISLSNVAKVPIESYYPTGNEDVMDSLSRMFNCTIFQKDWSTTTDKGAVKIHIFRCALLPLNCLDAQVFSQPNNHYVALRKPGTSSCDTCSLNEQIISPVLPGFGFDPSQVADVFEILSTTPVPTSPVPLQPASQQPDATSEVSTLTRPSKQRQSSLLDHMFTKKRKVSGDVIQQAEQVHVENAEEPSLPASSFEIPSSPPPVTISTSHNSSAVGSRFPNDIGNFVNISNPLTEQQKYDILSNVWKHEGTL